MTTRVSLAQIILYTQEKYSSRVKLLFEQQRLTVSRPHEKKEINLLPILHFSILFQLLRGLVLILLHHRYPPFLKTPK